MMLRSGGPFSLKAGRGLRVCRSPGDGEYSTRMQSTSLLHVGGYLNTLLIAH